jgi:uncharacterized protein (UPF0216 family)
MREKKLIKFIQAALKRDHMYSTDEIIYMKQELNNLKEELNTNKKLTNKGFGN